MYLFVFFCLRRENYTLTDETISSVTPNPLPGILKKSPDENELKLVENIKRKKGLFFWD